MSGAEGSGSAPGWRIGSLRGVPIYLGRTWPVIAVVIVLMFGPPLRDAFPELGMRAYLVSATYAVLLLGSVLVHEASHALMGQARGYRVSRIVADLWGGHTAYEHADTSPGSTALVAVVGPLSNGLLALAAWLLLPAMPHDVPYLLVGAVALSNAFVAAFNLLPGLPLDGGYLVDALVWKVTGSRATGMVVAGWCGRIVTVLVIAWALVLPLLRGESPSLFRIAWAAFLGTFLWMGASSAVRAGGVRRIVGQVSVRQVAQPMQLRWDDEPVSVLALPLQQPVAVHSTSRGLWGLVDAETIGVVPPAAREHTPLGAVARAQPDGWIVGVDDLDADVTQVIGAVQSSGAQHVAVVTRQDPPLMALVSASQLLQALHRAGGTTSGR